MDTTNLDDSCASLIQHAREGSNEALGELLDAARSYLRVAAAAALDTDLRGKLSASDLIQETFVEAQRDFSKFEGDSSDRFRAWLWRIMINNLLNQYRRFRDAQMRDVSREKRFPEAGLSSAILSAEGETPSHAAVLKEEQELLAEALQRVSAEHRQVIELRHREQLTFSEIGQRMNRSADAARMLWYRAFEQLSKELGRSNGNGRG